MKKTFVSMMLAAVCLITTTLHAKTGDEDEVRYEVSGTAPASLNGKQVSLYMTDPRMTVINTATIQKGKFAMKGMIPDLAIVMLRVDNVPTASSSLVLDNSKVNVTITAFFSNYTVKVEGSKNNSRLREYEEMVNGLMSDKVFGEEFINKGKSFIFDNLDNVVGGYAFGTIANQLDPLVIDSIFDRCGDEFLSNESARTAFMKNEAGKKRRTGNPFLDFELSDKEGRLHRLSDVVPEQEYTLLYFWESGSSSSRNDMPVLKRLYSDYHKLGLDIVGVSLEQATEQWALAVETLGLPWLNLCNPGGSVARMYGLFDVSDIPCMLLIGRDGKIVSSGKETGNIGEKLKELLGDVIDQGVASTEDSATMIEKVEYHVVGKLPPTANGYKVRFFTNIRSMEPTEMAVVKNGRFEFKGTVNSPRLARIYLAGGTFAASQTFVLENGVTTFTISGEKLKVDGDRRTKAFLECEDSVMILAKQGKNRQNEYFVRFLKRNNDNIVGAHYYRQYAWLLTEKERKELLNTASKEFLNYLYRSDEENMGR